MTRNQISILLDLKVSEAIKQTALKVLNDWDGKNLNRILR